ncbi:MAG: carbohydrate binding domain-containing protein [Sedimentisphaerales bacterium]
MRIQVIWLTAVFLIGFMVFSPSHAQEVQNILKNGGFENGPAGPLNTWEPETWNVYGNATPEVVTELVGAAVPEGPVEGDYCLHVVVPTAGGNFWDAGLQHIGHVFQAGKKYTLSAFFKSKSGTLQINFKPELGQDPWTGYGEQMMTITEEWAEYSTTTPVFTADVNPATITFHIAMTAGEFWVDAVRWYEGDYVPPVFRPRVTAAKPSPDDGAVDVPQDAVLSWEPGAFADTHNVYFGTVFDDVNNADTTNPLGVLASQGQTATTYDPEGLLEFGQTYYWRVDEVNAPPDSTVFKGDVWSFTAEPFAYPIAGTSITATASSQFSPDTGPENTIDGSGLDASDLHSTQEADAWISNIAGPQPTWIQYEFDQAYKLHELWVWNSNQAIEPVVGMGVKDVTIEYSSDGANWTTLATVEFARAPGTPGYAHNTTVDLSGVIAKYVRLTANSNWGGILTQYGLSEVRFFYVPVQAREPQPAVGQTDVALDAVLDWRAGREAASHEVYFSTDRQAVIDGTALVATVSESSYQPPLEYGQIYYWKVNEVNEAASPSSWEGEVWNFSTVEYSVVDDFEDYNDYEPDRIFDTWIDGWGVAANGSQVGYNVPPFAEQTIVHGGNQSMPLHYDNTAGVRYSEAERTFDTPQDWTRGGANSLNLWFRGNPVAFQESPAGTFTMSADGADIWGTADEFRYAYKQLNGDGQIIAKVVSIGGPGTNEWRKAGVMIRESLDGGSRHAFMAITPTVSHGIAFQNRPTANASSFSAHHDVGFTTPGWVKLVRQGAQFTGYYSEDGVNWTQVPPGTGGDASPNPQTINMSPSAYIGLALTSHQSGVSCVAEFSDVTITGAVTGDWQVADIGVDQPANTAAPMYVALEDSSGKSAEVRHPDPAATTISTWTQWSIDLADFTGVNPQSIKKMTIGVGDKAAPQPDSTGILYIDDILVGRPLPVPEEVVDLLVNGGFEDGVVEPWGVWGDVTVEVIGELAGAAVPEAPIEGSSCLHVTVNTPGANFWDSGLNQGGLVFEAGKKYTLSAWLKSKQGTMDINFKPELQQAPWTGYGEQVITMTEEWAEYSITTPVFTTDVSPGSITFHIGFAAGEFWIDGVRFYEGDYVPPEGITVPGEVVNILANGGFEDGVVEPWGVWGDVTVEVIGELAGAAVPEAPIEGSSCLHVTVNTPGANFWDSGLNQGGLVFEAGKKYTLSAWLKSKQGTMDINFKPELQQAPWTGYGEQVITMTEEWAEYSITTPVFTTDVSPGSITFHIGFAAGEFWIDGVRFYEGDYVPPGFGK